MTGLIIIGVIIIIFIFFRSKNNNTMYEGGGSSLITGAILGYLLSNALINNSQYDSWRNMDYETLTRTLLERGITTEDELVEITDRANSGQLDDFLSFEETDYSQDSFSSFDDSSGGWGDE